MHKSNGKYPQNAITPPKQFLAMLLMSSNDEQYSCSNKGAMFEWEKRMIQLYCLKSEAFSLLLLNNFDVTSSTTSHFKDKFHKHSVTKTVISKTSVFWIASFRMLYWSEDEGKQPIIISFP